MRCGLEPHVAGADRDIETLRDAGFGVGIDLEIYGVAEATVTRFGEEILIQG